MSLLLKDTSFQIPGKSTFICSTPSVGNVGQLATDSILATLNGKDLLQRIGCIESENILPVSGYDSFSEDAKMSYLCMPVEVYGIIGKNVFIIHQRSPCVKGKQSQYCDELVKILNSVNYRELIILTGAGTDDIEVMNRGQNFMATAASSTSEGSDEPDDFKGILDDEICKKLKILDISDSLLRKYIEDDKAEKAQLSQLQTDHYHAENDFDSFLSSSTTVFSSAELTAGNHGSKSAAVHISVVGLDLADLLYRTINKSSEELKTAYNLSILGLFCVEGDNRLDGKKLAYVLLSCLGLVSSSDKAHNLKHPVSWDVLFGAPLSGDSMSMFY